MRAISKIIVHCSATQEGRDLDAAEINRWHLKRGWNGIGALLPESRFVELARKYPAIRELIYSGRLDPSAFESHARVPMSAEDTRVFSTAYPVTTRVDALTQGIPFANGGSVASRLTGLGSMGCMI